MASQASYTKIGLTVVAGVAAIVATLAYLGGAASGDDIIYAETYSDTPVSGLSVGSDVNLRGVKVGEVREISFIGSEYDGADIGDIPKIYILMAFTARKMRKAQDEDAEEHLRELIGRGLHATVTSSGVTGLSKIELNFPRGEVERKEISWTPRHICIPPAPSMLESFSDATAKFMSQISKMDFQSAWSNISVVAESAANAASGVSRLVDDERENIAAIVRTLDEAATKAKDLISDLAANPSLLIRPSETAPLPETSRDAAP